VSGVTAKSALKQNPKTELNNSRRKFVVYVIYCKIM